MAKGLTLSFGALALPRSRSGRAQAKSVKIAMIAPLSGPWARQGQLLRMGAEMAVDDINSNGGIKSLGGAKLEIVYADAGDSTEKAKNAAQRLLSDDPELVGGTGAWLSSFTLAVTEVTERASLPWFTLSYSDAITNRGFKFVFQTSPTADHQAAETVPTALNLAQTATGKRPQTVGIIMDNTASPVSFAKPLRNGGFEKVGLKLVVDQVFTPPLSDATPLIEKVRSAKPDFLLLLTSAMPDCKLVLEKLDEFKLSHGKIPLVGNGAPFGSPELLKTIGARTARRAAVQRRELADQGPGGFYRALQKAHRRAVPDPGRAVRLWRYRNSESRAGSRRRSRPAQGRRCDPRDGPDHRAGRGLLPGTDQVRRKGPAGRRADDLRAMAKGRSADGLPDRPCPRQAVLAVGVGHPLGNLGMAASLSRPVSSPALITSCRCPFSLRLMTQHGALASLRGRHKPPHDGMRRMGRYNLSGALAADQRQDRRPLRTHPIRRPREDIFLPEQNALSPCLQFYGALSRRFRQP